MAATKPFLQGSRQIWKKVAAIAFVDGQSPPDTKIGKAGYLGALRFRFVGAANVTVAGTAGTPKLQNIIKNYQLTLSGNYQYRNIKGESLQVCHSLRAPSGSNDPVTNDRAFLNYNPASATNQTISYPVKDNIALNQGVNADEFLLAAQARNYDIILSLTFETANNIRANTETVAFSGTLYVEGLYQLDPDYSVFMAPDLTFVQQIVDDWSFTNVVVGDNVININPINGPEYMQLLLGPVYNNAADVVGPTSATTNFVLRVNNGQDIFNIPAQDLAAENFEFLGRALPFGYYLFDFENDISLNNAMSPFRTRLVSTATLNSLELIVTVANGTTVTNSTMKLIKRLRNPAIA